MFKKIATILTAWFCLMGVWVVNNKPIFSAFSSEYEVYSFQNGSNGDIQTTQLKDYLGCSLKYGEACVIDLADFGEKAFLEYYGATIVFLEQTCYGTSLYGYSPKIKYSTIINGEKINLHVFICENYVKVGSPIIFGSY